MVDTSFDEQIETLTGALGDATRRGIYVMIRESHTAVTASQIAANFQIHPNVARHHLDRLVTDGFIRVSDRQQSKATAGRPAKHYEATDKAVSVQYSSSKYDALAELLVAVIDRLDDGTAEEIASSVGHDYGVRLGAEIGVPDDEGYEVAAMAVATSMMRQGLGASTVASENRIVARFCPLSDPDADEPSVLRSLDEGIVRGLLESAAARPVVVELDHPSAS
ncbi:MAG: helix-turn-helix domain-containing protein [Acidimicrobiia bacterium]|nr:helix-turn-helix domain-containing protein [Acidimicrobiia bacterium]